MKPRSRDSGSSIKGHYLQYEESSDEDDVPMDSSDSDYDGIRDERQGFASMIGDNGAERHLDLSHEQESEAVFSAIEGFVSDSDLEDKIPKERNVGLKKEKGQKICTKVLGGIEVQEDVVDRSNQEKLEVTEPAIDYQAKVNIRNKRRSRQMKVNMPILMWELWEEQDDRCVEENARIITHLDNQTDVMVETAETPSDLILPLLRYQKEWLAWSLKQEESAARGGILADEMGMGKTIQAIALVLAKREFNRAVGEHNRVLSSCSSSAACCLPEIKATLVICPVVAVRQWENEIDRFTSKGSNKVLVYHGAKREKTLHEFSEYDFVITTYPTVVIEYRKNVMPPKPKCGCGKSFSERKMISHLRHCRDNIKTFKQSEQSPDKAETSKQKASDQGKASESEDDKKKEVHKKKRKNYNEKDFGGGSCTVNLAGVESGLRKRKISLYSVKWNRIILDEAHYIKERSKNTAKAVHALESSYKWALSGTPFQNCVGELYSLIRFLRILPYSYYFCKDCDCRTLDYSSTTACPNCLHYYVRHFCWWNKFVAKPIRTRGDSVDGRKAMILLNHKILKSILLRRTKKGRAADLSLPPRIVKLRRDSLDTKEEEVYTSVYNNCQAEFTTYVKQGVTDNYVHIFGLLMRLRQAVNHYHLGEYSESAMERSAGVGDDNNGEKVTSCAIKGFKPTSILNKIQLDGFQSSTKIDALREEIRFMLERDGSAKGIVFSQFTSFLDLIHYSLQKCGVNCVQLDGSMSMDEKDAAIKRFTEDPDCRIFLISLKAGGVALNLTVASHVFLMDPWWNPAIEKQAQGRIHRIGQHKPIRIVRFVIENTIEEKLLKLQQKKELAFEGTVDGSLEALGKLAGDDLRFLFS